jgi:hypothetical protein
VRESQCEDSYLQLPDVVAGSGPPDWTSVIHHRTDDLLVEQHTVSDGEAVSPAKQGTKCAQSLSCLLSNHVDLRRPGKLCMKCHPKIPRCFDPLYWFSDKRHCSGILVETHGLNKEHGSTINPSL